MADMTHNLKTDRIVFDMSWEGIKNYEIRLDDRNFHVEDELVLKETVYSGLEMIDGQPLKYTGRRMRLKVVSKVSGNYGLKDGWCILGVYELFRINDPIDIQL